MTIVPHRSSPKEIGDRVAYDVLMRRRALRGEHLDLAAARRRVDAARQHHDLEELRTALVDEAAIAVRMIEDLKP
jgi:hypothetical protein